MPSETAKYFYEEIKLITEGIGKTGLPEKLIEAAFLIYPFIFLEK